MLLSCVYKAICGDEETQLPKDFLLSGVHHEHVEGRETTERCWGGEHSVQQNTSHQNNSCWRWNGRKNVPSNHLCRKTLSHRVCSNSVSISLPMPYLRCFTNKMKSQFWNHCSIMSRRNNTMRKWKCTNGLKKLRSKPGTFGYKSVALSSRQPGQPIWRQEWSQLSKRRVY